MGTPPLFFPLFFDIKYSIPSRYKQDTNKHFNKVYSCSKKLILIYESYSSTPILFLIKFVITYFVAYICKYIATKSNYGVFIANPSKIFTVNTTSTFFLNNILYHTNNQLYIQYKKSRNYNICSSKSCKCFN